MSSFEIWNAALAILQCLLIDLLHNYKKVPDVKIPAESGMHTEAFCPACLDKTCRLICIYVSFHLIQTLLWTFNTKFLGQRFIQAFENNFTTY